MIKTKCGGGAYREEYRKIAVFTLIPSSFSDIIHPVGSTDGVQALASEILLSIDEFFPTFLPVTVTVLLAEAEEEEPSSTLHLANSTASPRISLICLHVDLSIPYENKTKLRTYMHINKSFKVSICTHILRNMHA